MSIWQSWIRRKAEVRPPYKNKVKDSPDIPGTRIQAPEIDGTQAKVPVKDAVELIVPVPDAVESVIPVRSENRNEEPPDETVMLDISEYEPAGPGENYDAWQTDDIIPARTFLRRASADNSNLPSEISVEIGKGEQFSIGRFDAIAGKKQSDFEFDKNTRAVSRRHAVIVRSYDGCYITDIGSTAGTYVNHRKIAPEASCLLSDGDSIAFGNTGIDYIWECNKRGDYNG